MARASFHPLAERELIDAAQYYELESPGLRRRRLQTFPYAFLYRVTTDRVRILAVMNLRRRPMYWVGRE